MKLQTIVAAAALLAFGAANAAVDQFDGVTSNGNGSLLLLKLDSTGATTGGLTVDLGFNYNDFLNNAGLAAANQKVEWNFAANTIKVNGNLMTGVTNDWASQFSAFAGDAAETKWAIASGSQKGTTVAGFLASGTPTTAQMTQQTSAVTANMGAVNVPLIKQAQTLGTLASADNGAYAMGSTDVGYVGTAYSLTTINGWKNNIKWGTWNADGASTNLTQVINNGSEKAVADSSLYTVDVDHVLDATNTLNGKGTFTLTDNTLVWQTAKIMDVTPAVPEPETYVLALSALAALVAFRRRAAK